MMLRTIKVLISGALLAYVIYSTDLWTAEGLRKLGTALAQANLHYLLAALLYVFFIDFVSSFKWFCLTRAIKLQSRLLELFRYYLIGRFFNLVLPSNIGGDLIRIHLQGRSCGEYAHSAAVVFLERMTGMITLMGLAFLIALLRPRAFQLPWLTVALGVSVAALALMLYLVADRRPLLLIRGPLESRLKTSRALFSKLETFRQSLFLYKDHPQSIAVAFANSLLFYLSAIGNVWISARVFDSQIGIGDMIVAVPLIMLIMNLPISIGSIGLMEFAYALVFAFVGIAPEVAVSTVLLMRIKLFLSAGCGYLLYAGIESKYRTQQTLAQDIRQFAAKRNTEPDRIERH